MSPLRNGVWMLLYQAARMALGVVLTAWVARSLGPGGFGDYHTVVAMALLFSSLATLGLQSVVIQNAAIASAPDAVLSTALWLRLGSGLLTVALALATVPLWAPPHFEWGWALALVVLVAQAWDVVEYGFISSQHMRPVALVHLTALLLTALTTWIGLLRHAGTGWFLGCFALEYILVATCYAFLFRGKMSTPLRHAAEWARPLLVQGAPMLVSSLAYLLYLRIDTVMLQALAGSQQAGWYSASARLAQMSLFLPMIVVNAVSAQLARSHREASARYTWQKQALYSLLATLGLGVALGCTLLGPWLVPLLFGEAYAPSAILLAWHGWIALPLFVRTGMDRVFVTEGHAKFNMLFHGTIALANVGLNFVLIPRFGALGAVVASLLAVVLGGFVLPLCFSTMRPGARQAWLGLCGPWLWLNAELRTELRGWLGK